MHVCGDWKAGTVLQLLGMFVCLKGRLVNVAIVRHVCGERMAETKLQYLGMFVVKIRPVQRCNI